MFVQEPLPFCDARPPHIFRGTPWGSGALFLPVDGGRCAADGEVRPGSFSVDNSKQAFRVSDFPLDEHPFFFFFLP